ncbi:MAG TPA: hypothetical protein VMT18_08175 [Planctomycetota bacterium]|nr:hypothetical protein [Planctomycetota bacterium]
MSLRSPHTLAVLALLSAPAQAQFLNRALWLGDEREPFRRDYAQDVEYFVDRYGIVDAPPWWSSGSPLADRIAIAAGSVTSRELTVETAAALSHDLGSGFRARLDYLQSEHQTTRFERLAFGLERHIGERVALFAQIEGTADKSRADLSLGVQLAAGEHSLHRLGLTVVDFAAGQSETFDYAERPYGLLAAGQVGAADSLRFAYELGLQLPFEERDELDGTALELWRAIGRVEASVPLTERDALVLGLSGERTSKSIAPFAGGTVTAEDGGIELARVTAEWWRRGAQGREYALGAWFLALDEGYTPTSAPDLAEDTRRRELMLTARARLPIEGAWSVEPYAVGGRVDLDRVDPGLPDGAQRELGFQGRAGVPLRYDFSGRAWLRIDFSMQLDQVAFGGAAVQLVASL